MAFTKEHAAQMKALREWGRSQGRKQALALAQKAVSKPVDRPAVPEASVLKADAGTSPK